MWKWVREIPHEKDRYLYRCEHGKQYDGFERVPLLPTGELILVDDPKSRLKVESEIIAGECSKCGRVLWYPFGHRRVDA